MKRIALFITLLLILLSSAGCIGAKSVQNTDSNNAAISDTTAPTKTSAPTTAPAKTSAPTPAPKKTSAPTPATTPTFAPLVFDVANVKMQPTPGSSCFSEIGYDSDWEVLVAKFKDSGSVYTYANFPKSEWDKFLAADSLGSWYNKYIKGRYEYERID